MDADEQELAIEIPITEGHVSGDLTLPERARGLIIFAHGSGSSRFSPRNRRVAAALRQSGFGTLLLDLLTPLEENADEVTGRFRFDVDLLAERVVAATDWASATPELQNLPIGLFGASTGAAAALLAAAERPDRIGAVVSRGGRPDLAGESLPRVRAPSLLIVGGNDIGVIDLNARALRALHMPHKDLRLVPRAKHLFEEPGALDEVIEMARGWFEEFLLGGRLGQQPPAH